MCVAGAAAAGLGSGRAPPSCRRRLGWWMKGPWVPGRDRRWDDGTDAVSVVGPPGRLPRYLNSVLCSALSGLGQSSLWSLTVHWSLLSYLP